MDAFCESGLWQLLSPAAVLFMLNNDIAAALPNPRDLVKIAIVGIRRADMLIMFAVAAIETRRVSCVEAVVRVTAPLFDAAWTTFEFHSL